MWKHHDQTRDLPDSLSERLQRARERVALSEMSDDQLQNRIDELKNRIKELESV
jgi:hypothetical protein